MFLHGNAPLSESCVCFIQGRRVDGPLVMLSRLAAGCCISLSLLPACASEPQGNGGTSDTSANAGRSSSGGGANGGSTSAVPNVGGGPGGLVLDVNAGSGSANRDDAEAGCSRLNIGILGNPGANASSNFQQWLMKSGTSAERIQTSADVPLTSAALEAFDVVVLDWLPRDYTAAEAEIFAAWVSAGGGVASMTGYSDNTSNDWRANSLLAPLGVAYNGSLSGGPIMSFATHPITTGLASVTFAGGYAVADLGGTASVRTPIAFLPNGGEPAAVAVQMGKGRAVVWGDEWIEFDSEWAVLPQITQLWVQLFAWIAPKTTCALMPPK